MPYPDAECLPFGDGSTLPDDDGARHAKTHATGCAATIGDSEHIA
jgi:hypothetical protein